MGDFFSDILGSVPVVGGLVSGGLDLLGSAMQSQGQQQSIQAQEAYQTSMSNSAYTRAVADMKNAGLNPALMYGSGGPESTPSGASMTPPNVLAGVGQDFTQALGQASTIDVQHADVALKTLQALTNSAQLPMYQAEGDLVKSLVPAMNQLEKFLQTSAGGVSTAGKVATSGMNTATDLVGDLVSDVSQLATQQGNFLSQPASTRLSHP